MAELNNTSSGQWSETDASNTSPSPDGWPSGTFFNQVEPIGRSTMGAIKRFWDRINGTVTTTGSSGTYAYTPVNTSYPTAYVNGEKYGFKAHQDSVGNDVFNLNSLGAKNIYISTSAGMAQIVAGVIKNGAHIIAEYDSTLNSGSGGMIILNGASNAIQGTATNDSATAGTVGEYISSNIIVASAVSLISLTPSNITSILLGAGDWQVWGNVGYLSSVSTATVSYGGFISTTSNAALPADANGGGYSIFPAFNNVNISPVFSVGRRRISLPSATNIYLEGYGNFTSGPATAYGFIGAIRTR